MKTEVSAYWLGRIGYLQCHRLQLALHERIARGNHPPSLLLLEHDPVITLGRHANTANVYLPKAELERRGVEVHEIERGGDVTYHGPGQLVGYPLLHLKSMELTVAEYMRRLEDSLVWLLKDISVTATREAGFTGVWHETGKIAAIGIAVRRWVTYHGFALNVTTDLSYATLINPCGLSRPVTSIEKVSGVSPTTEAVALAYLGPFTQAFEVDTIELSFGEPELEDDGG